MILLLNSAMTAISLLFFFCIFFIISEGILRLRSLTFSGLLPITMAAFIGIEAFLLNFLSLFQAVNRFWMVAAHLALIFCWMVWVWRTDSGRLLAHLLRIFFFFKKTVVYHRYQTLFPLLLIIGLTAWIYPPNNYDSLTYHMARVAHWIQNGSIAYYPTPIERQNVMGPGAEYLILFLQIISGQDYLAPFVQFFSFTLLIFSVGYLARILKLTNGLSLYVVIIAVTAPIAIMEASNTKNDLVASVMVYAILIAGARIYIGNIKRMRKIDYALTGVALAGGFLVKATSILIVFPIIAISLFWHLPTIIKSKTILRRCIVGSLVAGGIFCLFAGPDVMRKSIQGSARHEVYSLFSDYDVERLWNPVRVLVHNIPFPEQTTKILHSVGVRGDLITKDVYNLHEDMVGNPYQVTLFILLSAGTIFLSFFLPLMPHHYKEYFLALAPIGSWMLFGLVVKDQGWITRLEIPLFYILPFSFVFLVRLGREYSALGKIIYFVAAATAFTSLAYAFFIASNIPARPLALSVFWGERANRDVSYYHNANLKDEHDFFLKKVEDNDCRRVGLLLGPDSVDYPLTWRAMQRGVRAKHVWEQIVGREPAIYQTIQKELDRSCMLYVASGSRERVPRQGEQWLSAGDYHTFIRNGEWEFDHSPQTHLRIDARNGKELLHAQRDVQIEVEPDGIVLVATGDDSQISLVNSADWSSEQVVVKLEIFSPENTEVQLFYISEGNSAYSEEMSISRSITTGGNCIYFLLPSNEITGHLRIDVGKKPGNYKISSLEIRAL